MYGAVRVGTDGGGTVGDDVGPEVTEEEITVFADDRLPDARAAQIAERTAVEPDLAAEVGRQQGAVSLLRAAAEDAGEAPPALRARIDAARRPAPRAPRRVLLGGFAVAVAVAVALAVVFLPSGAGGPSVASAADLATRGAQGPGPVSDPVTPGLLAVSVDGVVFPGWADEFGWRGDGIRADELDGRQTRTVYYVKDSATVAYTIVAGDGLEVPDGRAVTRDGVDLRVFERDGRTVVTWRRDGRTCVLSAERVDVDTLTKLAVWTGGGNVSF